MKNEIVQLVIALLTVVFGGALEEILPKFSGVGFPILLVASIFWSSKRDTLPMLMFALVAGAAEDSLSSLPFGTSLAFFPLVAAFTKSTELKWSTYSCAYPLYQIWLGMWCMNLNGGVFARFLISIPVGLASAWVLSHTLEWVDKKGAVDEE